MEKILGSAPAGKEIEKVAATDDALLPGFSLLEQAVIRAAREYLAFKKGTRRRPRMK